MSYLTHDVLGHRHPFFGPIAAVVCLSATNMFRGQRAAQMIVGEVVGIGLGAWVQTLLGAGPIAVAGAVFIAMCVAMLIGHSVAGPGLMFFVNQAAVTAVLVVALGRSGLVVERLVDTVVGGGLAVLFAVLVFPANPVTLLGTNAVQLPLTADKPTLNGRSSPAGQRGRLINRLADRAAPHVAVAGRQNVGFQ